LPQLDGPTFPPPTSKNFGAGPWHAFFAVSFFFSPPQDEAAIPSSPLLTKSIVKIVFPFSFPTDAEGRKSGPFLLWRWKGVCRHSTII